MTTTIDLLDKALSTHPAPYWHERLNLSRNALHQAKQRGHVSPAIAGALAEELGEDPKDWIVVAALESERASACKDRMVKRFENWRKRFLSAMKRLNERRNGPADRRGTQRA